VAQYCPPYPHIHRDQSNLQYRGEHLDDYVYNVDRELINPNLPRSGSRYRFLRLHCYRVPTIRRMTTISRNGTAGCARYDIVRKSVKALSFGTGANDSVAGADISAYAYARSIYFSRLRVYAGTFAYFRSIQQFDSKQIRYED